MKYRIKVVFISTFDFLTERAFIPCLFILMGGLWPISSAQGQTLPCPYNITTGSVTLTTGSYTGCSLTVSAGATLVIDGSVTLNLTGNVDIEGTLEGAGNGYGSIYAPSPGPGAGGNGSVTFYYFLRYLGGGGAGHGGAGGGSPPLYSGGVTYDSPTNPVFMGSEGGTAAAASGPGQLGGAGGAALLLSAPSGYVTLNGTIDLSGGVGMATTVYNAGGGGGGAGGTLSIDALGIGGKPPGCGRRGRRGLGNRRRPARQRGWRRLYPALRL